MNPESSVASVRPRTDRAIYTWAALVAVLIVFAGFARSYYLKGLFGTPALTGLVHLHGVVMSLWFALFATQVWLVARGRTGVLVFLSLLEGMAELVYDVGVEIHVEPEEHEALRAALERALPEKGVAVAAALEKLGDLLEPRLPRAEDDVNELPDEVG